MTGPWKGYKPLAPQAPQRSSAPQDTSNPWAGYQPVSPGYDQIEIPGEEEMTPRGPVTSRRGDFMAGLIGGFTGGVPASVGHFLKAVGLDELGQTIADPSEQRAARESQGRITQLKDVNSLGDAADYIQYSAGNLIAQMAPSLASGYAGAAAGTALGGPGIGTIIGGMIGAALPSYIQNTGDVYQEIESMGAGDRKGLALALGVPIAALDAITPGDLANRIVAKQVAKSVLEKVGYTSAKGVTKELMDKFLKQQEEEAARGLIKRGIKSTLKEAATEGTQEAIQHLGVRAGTDRPLELPLLLPRVGEAAVQGAMGGFGASVGADVYGGIKASGKPKPKPDATPTPEQKDARRAEAEAAIAAGEEVKKQRQAAVIKKLRAANAWYTWGPEKRKANWPGLSDADYHKAWKDLSPETQAAIQTVVDAESPPEEPPAAPPAAPAVPPTPPGGAPAAPGVSGSPEGTVPGGAPSAEPASQQRKGLPEDISVSGEDYRKAFTNDQGVTDTDALSKHVRKYVQEALDRGDQVFLVMEGKPHQILSVSESGLKDRQGNPWGVVPLIMGKPGDDNRVVVRPKDDLRKKRLDKANEPTQEPAPTEPTTVVDIKAKETSRRDFLKTIGAAIGAGQAVKGAISAKVGKRSMDILNLIGKKATQTIYNPAALDAAGNPAVIIKAGDHITREILGEILGSGISEIPSSLGLIQVAIGKDVTWSPTGGFSHPALPAPKPWTGTTQPAAEPSPYEGLPKGPDLVDEEAAGKRAVEEAKAKYEESRKKTPEIRLTQPEKDPADDLISEFNSTTQENPLSPQMRIVKVGDQIGSIRIAKPPSGKGGRVYAQALHAVTRGGGRVAFQHLLNLADTYGVEVVIKPEPYEAGAGVKMSEEKLREWYKGFGFKDMKEGFMIRKPGEKAKPKPETEEEKLQAQLEDLKKKAVPRVETDPKVAAYLKGLDAKALQDAVYSASWRKVEIDGKEYKLSPFDLIEEAQRRITEDRQADLEAEITEQPRTLPRLDPRDIEKLNSVIKQAANAVKAQLSPIDPSQLTFEDLEKVNAFTMGGSGEDIVVIRGKPFSITKSQYLNAIKRVAESGRLTDHQLDQMKRWTEWVAEAEKAKAKNAAKVEKLKKKRAAEEKKAKKAKLVEEKKAKSKPPERESQQVTNEAFAESQRRIRALGLGEEFAKERKKLRAENPTMHEADLAFRAAQNLLTNPEILARLEKETAEMEEEARALTPADKVAMLEQRLDTFAQLKAEKYANIDADRFYSLVIENDPALAHILTDRDMAELMKIRKDLEEATKAAPEAAGSGLMPTDLQHVMEKTDAVNKRLATPVDEQGIENPIPEKKPLADRIKEAFDVMTAATEKYREYLKATPKAEWSQKVADDLLTEPTDALHALLKEAVAEADPSEHIVAAAIKFDDGTILQGESHIPLIKEGRTKYGEEATKRALMRGGSGGGGFVTNKGRYVDALEGAAIAIKSEQMPWKAFNVEGEYQLSSHTFGESGLTKENVAYTQTEEWKQRVREINKKNPPEGPPPSATAPTEPAPPTTPAPGTEPQAPPGGPPEPQAQTPPSAPGPEGPATTGSISREEFEAGLDAADAAHEQGVLSDDEYTTEIARLVELHKGSPRPPQALIQVEAAHNIQMPDTMGKDLNTFTPEQLTNTKKSIASQLRNPVIKQSNEGHLLSLELDRIFDFESKRKGLGEAGFLVVPGGRKVVQRMRKANLSPSEQYFSDKVPVEPEMGNRWNMIKWLRQIRQGWSRSTQGLNNAVRIEEKRSGPISAEHHAGKLAEMIDGFLTRSEAFLRGDGPFLPDENGGMSLTGAKSLASIVEHADGQVERLGWLWAAKRALDLKKLKDRDIGIDLAHAMDISINAPESLHEAVDMGRQYHFDLARYGEKAGLLSQDQIDDFSLETAYGPIQRIFDNRLIRTLVEQIKLTGKSAKQILGEQPFKRLQGSDLPIRNMVESSIDVTYRTIRASDMNNMANTLVELARKNPEAYREVIRPLEHKYQSALRSDMVLKAQSVKEMFAAVGIDLTNEHANLFANMLSDESLNVESGVLRVWNKGEIELWQVDDMIADSLRSMMPHEFSLFTRFMGAAARPFRLGIVLDPMFIAGQVAIDQVQGWMNTRYGFVPVYDAFRGWWHLFHETAQAKEAMRAGGVERGGLRNRTGLQEIVAGPNLAPKDLFAEQVRTMHPFKAINTFLTPIREATRMGEYLRAREHGASPLEAAWNARDLLGNYSVEGTFTTIRALNHMAAFSRPAIAVLDKSLRTIKERPGQWFTRGAVLAIGAALLYAANADDDEIKRLRQSRDGQRWFFYRLGGTIFKWRKPYLEGAIFASSMEAALDMYFDKNPNALSLWADAIKNEVQLNMMPVLGAMYYAYKSGQDINTGAPIIPESEQRLAPEYQVGYSGSFERLVGKKVGVSPAIISYVARGLGGYLGESAVRGISAAIDYTMTGEAPPKEDWPLAQRLFAKYPSQSVGPVREFYKELQKIDEAATTLDYVYENDPERIDYYLQKYQEQLPLIEYYNEARQEINDLRDSMNDIEDVVDVGPQTKKLYRDSFLKQIIEISESVNAMAHAIKSQTLQIANP